MAKTLWTLPVPSTALLSDVSFQPLPNRACALLCEYEGEDDSVMSLKLLFGGVEAFKCTYQSACRPDMIEAAYDKVVDVGPTEWLATIQEQLVRWGAETGEVKHLITYYDDGPCYEFICRSFRIEERLEVESIPSVQGILPT
jgi:hypothetical protein